MQRRSAGPAAPSRSRPSDRTDRTLSKNARTFDLEGAGPTRSGELHPGFQPHVQAGAQKLGVIEASYASAIIGDE